MIPSAIDGWREACEPGLVGVCEGCPMTEMGTDIPVRTNTENASVSMEV